MTFFCLTLIKNYVKNNSLCYNLDISKKFEGIILILSSVINQKSIFYCLNRSNNIDSV